MDQFLRKRLKAFALTVNTLVLPPPNLFMEVLQWYLLLLKRRPEEHQPDRQSCIIWYGHSRFLDNIESSHWRRLYKEHYLQHRWNRGSVKAFAIDNLHLSSGAASLWQEGGQVMLHHCLLQHYSHLQNVSLSFLKGQETTHLQISRRYERLEFTGSRSSRLRQQLDLSSSGLIRFWWRQGQLQIGENSFRDFDSNG